MLLAQPILQDPGMGDFQTEGSGESGMARVARMVEELLPRYGAVCPLVCHGDCVMGCAVLACCVSCEVHIEQWSVCHE